jgi:anti-sigma regulatory factor (Ser/Thr protein kinase)
MLAEIALNLPRSASAPAVARGAIDARFAGLGQQRLTDLALVVTELATNAVVHGHGDIRLKLQHDDDDLLRGEVIDQGGGFEQEVRDVGPSDFGGRGLLILEALASRWGIHEGTTHVWFELQAPGIATGSAKPHLGDARRPAELA